MPEHLQPQQERITWDFMSTDCGNHRLRKPLVVILLPRIRPATKAVMEMIILRNEAIFKVPSKRQVPARQGQPRATPLSCEAPRLGGKLLQRVS